MFVLFTLTKNTSSVNTKVLFT